MHCRVGGFVLGEFSFFVGDIQPTVMPLPQFALSLANGYIEFAFNTDNAMFGSRRHYKAAKKKNKIKFEEKLKTELVEPAG